MENNYFHTGFFAQDVLNLTAEQAHNLCETDAILVDVRESYLSNFKIFRVNRIIYMPSSGLKASYRQLPADTPLIFADAVGLHSREAVIFMMEMGYHNVANLSGGITDWERDGFPVTTDKEFRLSGSCICQLKPREHKS